MANKTLGLILMAFVGLMITISFASVIGDSISEQTDGITVTNASYTTAATANGTTEITGKINLGTLVVYFSNATDTYDWSSNFSITRTGNDLFLKTTDDAYAAEQNATAVLISYTYGNDNYVEQTSSRSIIPLILLFAVIGILALVLPLPIRELFKMGVRK